VSSTVALTMKLLVEMTTICADVELDELLADEDAELDAELDAEEPADPPAKPLPEVPVDPPLAPLLEPPVEAEPEPEVVLLLDTCWPTLRLTEATVPAMVDVSEALARLVWAEVTWDCAEVTDAWSEVIWLDKALFDWSLDNLAWAALSEAWAESTVACRAEGSTVASV
jgi:hypothetical protein